jgi:hypothetical protein
LCTPFMTRDRVEQTMIAVKVVCVDSRNDLVGLRPTGRSANACLIGLYTNSVHVRKPHCTKPYRAITAGMYAAGRLRIGAARTTFQMICAAYIQPDSRWMDLWFWVQYM